KRGKPFHICITDIMMPGISGYDLAKQIRGFDSSISTIPILALSSANESRPAVIKESGLNGFLPKPVRRKKLLKMIERILGENEKRESLENDTMVTRQLIEEEAKHAIHILLAEDNPINRKLTSFMLTKAGYRLSMVVNGQEAVDLFTSEPKRFDLILMDIQMPVKNGMEATRSIRQQGFTDIPIIAITAQSMKGDREKCIEAGMNDYISKPIKREIVFTILKKWVLSK
ncbi:MAG: response regulator, partial [bacterium]|nr:response regulator [bacterium]